MSLRHHADLERALLATEARLKALDVPAPAPGGDDADQRTARQNVEDLVAEKARLHVAQGAILAALVRIDRGEYGSCLACGLPIAAKRLDAEPAVERCVDCQDAKERREATARGTARWPEPAEDDDEGGQG